MVKDIKVKDLIKLGGLDQIAWLSKCGLMLIDSNSIGLTGRKIKAPIERADKKNTL